VPEITFLHRPDEASAERSNGDMSDGRVAAAHGRLSTTLGSRAAERLGADTWAGAEAQLADKVTQYTSSELRTWAPR